MIKIENVSQAEQINEKLSRPLDYAKGLSALVSLSVYKPIVHGQDKTGLRAKIKLVDFQNEKLNASLQTSFEKLLEKRKLAYTKTFYTESMPVYSVAASQVGAVVDGLESERSTGLLYSIESMPRYGVVADELPVMASIVLPVPRADIKFLLILRFISHIADSGMMRRGRLLSASTPALCRFATIRPPVGAGGRLWRRVEGCPL